MLPNKEHIVKLAAKWEQGIISPEEEIELHNWYQQNQDAEIILAADFAESEEMHKQRIWNTVQQQINAKNKVRSMFGKRRMRSIAAAAAILIVVGAGILFYTNRNVPTSTIAQSNDIAPGSTSATLTLDNGKKIKLTDSANSELADDAGVTVSKSADGSLIYKIKNTNGKINKANTLSTDNGETFQISLPDGSKVYLNAASSLTYNSTFIEKGRREVKLKGEAYFEVVKDKKHPFVVKTNKQEIEVLGTHFNVMAYPDETVITTTLVEGSVKIIADGKENILKPNEQALNTGEALKIVEANSENFTDWKDGDFYFENMDFRSVMREIARWYDVEVVYDKSVPDDIRSGGWISRNNNLSAVLRAIEKSGQAHFKLEGKKIFVTR